MKIIYRYILKEFFESFVFGLAVFSSILLLDQVFQLINLFLSKGISFVIVVKLFLLVLPNILSLTIPMSCLFAILLAYGRLSEDNEITALRSSGIGYAGFTMPILAMVLLLCGFLVVFNQRISPGTHQQFRKIYHEIINQRPLLKFEENAVTTIGDYRLFVQKVDKDRNMLYGVNIYKFSKEAQESPWRISASSATVSASGAAVIFSLNHGFWQNPNPAKPLNLVNMSFAHYQFMIPLGDNIMPLSQSFKEMTGPQLLNEIKTYKLKKMPTNLLENEYWLRWILACAPLVFALAGIPLGIVTERGGKSIGFGLSLLVMFGYYLLLVTGLNLGEKGYAPPALVLWLPNVATALVGLIFWKRMLRS